jgi:apolipoprotein N-acyltransferase
MKTAARSIFAGLLILAVIIEALLAFIGPMAFRKKVSIMAAPTYSHGLSDDEDVALREYVESALAKSGQYRIVTHDLIRNYYLEQHDDPDFQLTADRNYREYAELAAELGIEQLAVISGFSYRGELSVTVFLRSTPGGERIHHFIYRSADLDSFMAGESSREVPERNDRRFFLIEDLRESVQGIEIFDYVFFFFLVGELALALLLLAPRRKGLRWILELISMAGLLLFLFSYVYSQNAGLDYVQRFIASGGRIELAPDTRTEQLYAFARFLPLLLINAVLYILGGLSRWGGESGIPSSGDGFPRKSAWLFRLSDRINRTAVVLSRAAGPWGFAFALVSALAFSLSFPSFLSLDGFPLLAWISLIPLFLAVIEARAGRGILYGVSFGMLSTLILNYWHGTYSYVSLAFSVGLGGILFSLWVIPWVLSIKLSGKWGFIPATTLWVVFEYLRSVGYIGYPWGLAGVSQYSMLPVIQAADLGGVYIISFVLVAFNAGLAWWAASLNRGWRWGGMGGSRVPAAFAAVPVILLLAYGYISLMMPGGEVRQDMRIALIQQNTDPRKHDYQLSFDTLLGLSREAMAEARVDGIPIDLLVWPEGGFKSDIRYWLERPDSTIRAARMVRDLLDFVAGEAGQTGTWLLTGTQDHGYETNVEGEEVRRNFNSTALINPDGELAEIYHKMHLVPFTEHFPYDEELPWLAELLDSFNTSNWKMGEERTVFQHPSARFFTPICFEDIFAEDLRRFAPGEPQIIVNVSNDYWSLTPVEGKQHGIHALFRSVENRIPTVRATASGLTAYIDSRGRLGDQRLPYYEAGYLLVDVPIRDFSPTPYQRLGDWPVLLCAIGWFLSLLQVWYLRGRKRITSPAEPD